ncbi:MAG: VWA domain-containing protein [Proteobacteria bacterium]|nr:VWA domain-containing protein [Pseudomonadota bacterium]
MQRWHLTAGLGLVAALAALVAPDLRASTSSPELPVDVPAHQDPVVLDVSPVPIDIGNLHVTAGLDHPAVLDGQTVERLMVITIAADDVEGESARPVNVSVVMDRSGSMGERGKMTHAKAAARELVEALDADDHFSFITFSDRAQVRVPMSQVLDGSSLIRSIDAVSEGGGTNLYEGLSVGLSQLSGVASDSAVNRVIVLSDGKANVGVTSLSQLSSLASRDNDGGVRVSTIGLGLDYNEDLLAEMADRGGGTYRFVSDADTLAGVFREELHQMSTVAASGVSVDVDLEGTELIDVYGYDEQVIDDGFRIWIGDVYGGQTRKVVARVRMRATGVGTEHLAGVVQVSESAGALQPIDVTASVENNRLVVEKTVNRELAILGNEAEAGDLAQQAASAYQNGDRKKSVDLLDASSLVAGMAASRYSSPRLEDRAAALEEQNVQYEAFEPETDEGRYNIKMNKEVGRDWAY